MMNALDPDPAPLALRRELEATRAGELLVEDAGDSLCAEEQPIALAFCDSAHDFAFHELIYDGDFFWGTVFGVDTETAQAMTAANNKLLEKTLSVFFPTRHIMLIVANYCHFHF